MKRPIGHLIRVTLRRTPLRNAVMAYRHLGLRADDVFLASYPRSGNTWLKSLISTYVCGEAMNDFSDVRNTFVPIVGFHRGARAVVEGKGRLIKTHESFRSEYRRAIWIVRHPGDVLVSEYRLALRKKLFDGTLDDYTEHFVQTPVCAGSNWEHHTLSWAGSPLAGTSQMLSLRYDELREKTEETLQRILVFLGFTLVEDKFRQAIEKNRIESMETRHAAYAQSLGNAIVPGISPYNGGAIGGWREILSDSSTQTLLNAFGKTMTKMGYQTSLSEPISGTPVPDHA